MGTIAWRNWQASLRPGGTDVPQFEEVLYSDARFLGEKLVMGPYIAISTIPDEAPMMPALVLRGKTLIDSMPNLVNAATGELEPSNSRAYHGGSATDEIAALLSLTLGVRCRAGGTTRVWGLQPDPLGSPVYWNIRPLHRPGPPLQEILPRVVARQVALTEAEGLLKTFPRLPEKAAIALVRAARLYSNGLWWANEDPNFAWLQLVAAVEVVAGTIRSTTHASNPIANIKDFDPEIWSALTGANAEVKNRVAAIIFRRSKATRKFLDLINNFLPPPPQSRPELHARVEWDRMEQHMKKIYDHRSRALHDGTPFPYPMLNVPRIDEQRRVDERPVGMSAGAHGATWMAAELPMTLQTFEHIVRGCILGWWTAQANQ